QFRVGVDVLAHGVQVAGDIAQPIQDVLVWAHGDSPRRRVFPFFFVAPPQITAMGVRGQSKVVPPCGTSGQQAATLALAQPLGAVAAA
ncbi:hypothetical protein O6466_24935, partial [Salmonella enterica subsp. enterica]